LTIDSKPERGRVLETSWTRTYLAAAIVLAGPAFAAPEEFVIDPGHAFPSFEVHHLGIATQRGRFNHTTGTVMLDREAGVVSVEVKIDARSIDTGNEALDNLLRGPSFFDVERFPEIRYKSSQATLIEGKPTQIDGELTLLGITRPVVLAVSNYQCTRKPFLIVLRCGVDMSTSFRRSEFGMSAMSAFAADEVTILIQAEAVRDGLYLLGTNTTAQEVPATGVLAHYKNLLEVEDAFCHLKSYLQVRPVFHWRPDRVRNHARLCFIAYWLSAKLELEWRRKDETIEVHNLLRQLQCIRLGRLEVGGKVLKTGVTRVPKDMNALLDKLGLLPLFAAAPAWASAGCSK